MSTESAECDTVAASACDVSVDLEGVVSSSNVDAIGDLGVATSTMLAKLDLSLACFSEKVSNLSIFAMHLATMESEFEALDLVKDHIGLGSFENVLEFDLLSGVLDSQIRELGGFLDTLQAGIAEARERVCSCTHLREALTTMQDKLLGSEQYLKQSEEQFNEIKMQSASFQRSLSSFKKAETAGDGKEGKIIREGDESLNVNAEIKLQTAEQRRYILRMLDKSLAREMDLEKNLYASRETEEKLKLRIFSLEQELVDMEEEGINVWERLFEANNACEILMGISKGLLGRLQISQFKLNGLSHHEFELRAKLETSVEQLKTRDVTFEKIESRNAELNSSLLDQTNSAKDAEDKLIRANSEIFTLTDKVSLLEKQLQESEFQRLNTKASADQYLEQYNVVCSEVRDMGNLIVDLKQIVSNEKSRADSAEAKCKLLTDTNSKLNEELIHLKGHGDNTKRVDFLKRQLRETHLRLRNTVASAEASQEKQSMLYSTISDMENVIQDLRSKVSKAESQADSAEENCIILSESNAKLNEELEFMGSRLECLEGSLHREEEAKMLTAKEIGKQTKFLKNLVTQLAIERERLKQQVSTLASENKILVVKLMQSYKDPS